MLASQASLSVLLAGDGDEWVLNGEKWFTSNGAAADFLIVMAITSPEKDLLERASMFIVDRDTPGVEIVRNVHGFRYTA